MNKRRLVKVAQVAAALLAVQGVLLAGYRLLSESARPARTIVVERLTPTPLPALSLASAHGSRALTELKGPLLLHFWATWCAPCRDELPALLALEGVAVVAVSVDQSQELVDRFFDGAIPKQVWRIDHATVRGALAVDTLPVTFFVDDVGRIIGRVDGAQAWGASPLPQWE